MLIEILKKLNSDSTYLKMQKALENSEHISVFSSNLEEQILFSSSIKTPFIIVASDIKKAQLLKENFKALNKKTYALLYKSSSYIYHTAEQADLINDYYKALYELSQNNLDVLIITPEVMLQKLPSKELFEKNKFELKVGSNYSLEKIVNKLVSLGYRRQAMVEKAGDFSVRGDILDVFCAHSPIPYRVQFFDDEIESINTFNTLTYTTIAKVEKLIVSPNTLIFIDNNQANAVIEKIKKSASTLKLEPNYQVSLNNILEHIFLMLNVGNVDASLSWCTPFLQGYNSSILDYVGKDAPVLFFDAKKIVDEFDFLYKEFASSIKRLLLAGGVLKEHANFYFNKKEVAQNYINRPLLAYQAITSQNRLFIPKKVFSTRISPIASYVDNFKRLENDIKQALMQQKTVILSADNASSSVHLQNYLKQKNIDSTVITSITQLKKEQINIMTSGLKRGVSLIEEKLFIVGCEQLFGRKKLLAKSKKQKTRTFTMPKVGDYVVHDIHGIGLCKSIEKLKLSGYEKDYILIEYSGGDKVYLPTEQVELISSYVGSEEKPKLNKIGGAEFSRQKEKVKNSVKKMAVNLVELYASRQKRKGFAFDKDDEMQRAFEDAFPYTETEDQLKAINEVKADMESAKIMDRLICGDVGYGKTEVALRAAFKAVMSGKQVAFLAPTTILAEQHYNTCIARMNSFLVNCDVLSRFKTSKEVKESLKKLQDGTTNVVCGTHRLLSKDVKFKDLGLLILDEEQRFGVGDKEKIKELKKHIDVLTMSATPIPRTLHMSMIGVRDISLIETPPQNRLPVQTFVTEYSNTLLVDAVEREMIRGGQVLVIHNRVDSIYTVFDKLKKLLPNVKMQVAHGQMKKQNLEVIIKDLYDGKIQLLLATTLIENGIDLPNANTLVVLNSNYLGLSQLYQLRGRVGRSSRLGYAYFTYEKQTALSESAYKRLNAINEFTELGSGFKIALRDLEIRGAGNILGREQHGHMGKVGYNMYCRILEEAVKEIKGEKLLKNREIKINVELNAFIPKNFIEDDENRFRLYSRFSDIETREQLQIDLKQVEDIYGFLPSEVKHLANIAYMKNLGSKLGLKLIVITKNVSYIEFYDKENALNSKISKALANKSYNAVLKFENSAKIYFELKEYSNFKKLETVIKFLEVSS